MVTSLMVGILTMKLLFDNLLKRWQNIRREMDVPTVKRYDNRNKRIPYITIISKQLGWGPKTSLWDLLESTTLKNVTAKPTSN